MAYDDTQHVLAPADHLVIIVPPAEHICGYFFPNNVDGSSNCIPCFTKALTEAIEMGIKTTEQALDL